MTLIVDRLRSLYIHRLWLVIHGWGLHIDRLRLNIDGLLLHIHRTFLLAGNHRADDGSTHHCAYDGRAGTPAAMG